MKKLILAAISAIALLAIANIANAQVASYINFGAVNENVYSLNSFDRTINGIEVKFNCAYSYSVNESAFHSVMNIATMEFKQDRQMRQCAGIPQRAAKFVQWQMYSAIQAIRQPEVMNVLKEFGVKNVNVSIVFDGLEETYDTRTAGLTAEIRKRAEVNALVAPYKSIEIKSMVYSYNGRTFLLAVKNDPEWKQVYLEPATTTHITTEIMKLYSLGK